METLTQPRILHEITDWKHLAFTLYRKAHGRRCVECSKIVEPEDAAMFQMEGLDEVILIHKDCR